MNKRLREKILAEWRGLPQRDPPPDRVKTIRQGVEKLMESLGLGERLDESEVSAEWKEIVGDFLAAHSVPTGLREGCLTVRVTQPTVRYELETAWKSKILSGLQKRFGKKKIQSIRFQL